MIINHIAGVEIQENFMAPTYIMTKPAVEVDTLIKRCLNGERLAQSELYKRWYNQVFAVCQRYANDRDESKSLVNATFFKVFKNLGKYSATGAFGGWIKRIAINTCIDHVRSKNKIHYMEPNDLPEPLIENNIINQLSAEDILAALQKVAPMSRTVFSLYVVDGYKHREIADMLDINESTSRWHLSNAKKELRELLKNY